MLACQQKCKTRAVSLTNHPWENLLRCKAIAKAASGTIQLRSPLQASLHGLLSRSQSWRALPLHVPHHQRALASSSAGVGWRALAHQRALAGGRRLAARWEKLLRCKAIAKAASGTIQLRSPLQASLHGLLNRSQSWRALPLRVPHHQRALAGRRWLINRRWLAGLGLLPGCCPAGPSPQPQPAPARAALPRASSPARCLSQGVLDKP